MKRNCQQDRSANESDNMSKRVLSFAILVSFLVLFSTGSIDPYARKTAETGGPMLESNGVEYPKIFANFQENSNVGIETKAKGKLKWAKEYTREYGEDFNPPRVVLISGNAIGVPVAENKFFIFDGRGNFKRNIHVRGRQPLLFARDSIAYFDPSNILHIEDLDGKILYEGYAWASGTDELANTVLLDLFDVKKALVVINERHRVPPVKKEKGFIPTDGVTSSYNAALYSYNTKYGENVWSNKHKGSRIDQALLTKDKKTLILIGNLYANPDEAVTLLDTSNGKVILGMNPGFNEFMIASLDLEDNIVAFGKVKKGNKTALKLKSMDLSGKDLWSVDLSKLISNEPPACGTDGRVYIVDGPALKCFKNGKIKWEDKLRSEAQGKTWLTVAKNDSLIVINDKELTMFDTEGKKIFETVVTKNNEENFGGPASIGPDGSIFLASDLKLYCYE